MRTMGLVVGLGLLAGFSGLSARVHAAGPVFSVYVTVPRTDDSPDVAAADIEDLRHSVADLQAALGDRKKTFAVVESADKAQVSVEVVSRTMTVPRIVFGPAMSGVEPGAPMMGAPARAVHLKVRATFHGSSIELTNKNNELDTNGGWKTAAEDLAKQLDLWVHHTASGGR